MAKKTNYTTYGILAIIAGAIGYYYYKKTTSTVSGINTKNLNYNVFAYILDHIDSAAYNVKTNTEKEKLQFLADTFKSEYGHMISRIGNQKALEEWYQGLPSAINIDYTYYDIEKLARKWGSISPNATDSQINKITSNWFNFLAAKTIVLFNKYKINY